jgi:hypothetical protein
VLIHFSILIMLSFCFFPILFWFYWGTGVKMMNKPMMNSLLDFILLHLLLVLTLCVPFDPPPFVLNTTLSFWSATLNFSFILLIQQMLSMKL